MVDAGWTSRPVARCPLFAAAALVLGVALANPASAYTSYEYVDVDRIFEPLTGSASGTFDLKDPGSECFLGLICDSGVFDPSTDVVDEARVDFVFGISQPFGFELGAQEIASVTLTDPLSGTGLQSGSVDRDDRIFLSFYLEHFDANAEVVAQLNGDGTLGWEIQLAGADAVQALAGIGCRRPRCGVRDRPPYLMAAILTASGAPIPEPSAALLFCLGFGVVGAAMRRCRVQ